MLQVNTSFIQSGREHCIIEYQASIESSKLITVI